MATTSSYCNSYSSSRLNTDFLLPGLPNDLVCRWILPRFPWYERPRLRLLSNYWYEEIGLIPSEDTLQLQNIDPNSYCVWNCKFLLDAQGCRKLPEAPPPCFCVAACSGKVFAFSLVDFSFVPAQFSVCVWVMDISAGQWEWERIPRNFCTVFRDAYFGATVACASPDSGKIVFFLDNLSQTVLVFDAVRMEWVEKVSNSLKDKVVAVQPLPGDELLLAHNAYYNGVSGPKSSFAIYQIGTNTWRDFQVEHFENVLTMAMLGVPESMNPVLLVQRWKFGVYKYDYDASQWIKVEIKVPEGFELEIMCVIYQNGTSRLQGLCKSRAGPLYLLRGAWKDGILGFEPSPAYLVNL